MEQCRVGLDPTWNCVGWEEREGGEGRKEREGGGGRENQKLKGLGGVGHKCGFPKIK